MHKYQKIILFAIAMCVWIGRPFSVYGDTPDASYVGSQACQRCHEAIYDGFMKTGHAHMVNRVVQADKPPAYPFSAVTEPPDGHTWDDVTYVLGGYGWKARFLGRNGYLITLSLIHI